MRKENNFRHGAASISENLKKGVTELLILSLLNKRNMHVHEIMNFLEQESNSACKVAFPYAAVYRLCKGAFVVEAQKDYDAGRLRQFYGITDDGRAYFLKLREEYDAFIEQAGNVLNFSENGK